MRLIDANALKKEFERPFWEKWEWEIICKYIDNAPTVLFPLTVTINDKVTDEDIELLKRLMKDYKPQFLNLETERPQGEWIKVTKAGTVPVEYICSLCRRKIYDNYELTTPIDEFYPFCHCGADMRKSGQEAKKND